VAQDHQLAERTGDIGKEISARELIRDYDSLGIPHFQRGLVWSDENTALLVESLYFSTPCGTIILWEAKNPEKEGIPLPTRPGALPRSGSRKPQYLIVDGQQRIRSLRTALGCFVEPLDTAKNESSGPGPLTPESGGSDGVWCLNLTRVPELAEFFGDDSALRFSMFCLSELTKEKAPRWKNLVPLSTFFGRTEADASGFIATARRGEVLRRIAEIPLTDRIQSLLKNKVFFLKILHEQQNNDISRGSHEANNLPQVVALYNRINSAGKRVEAEEKAFATLVSLQPSTSKWLSDLFKDVHPEKSDSDPRRDDILKRRKERNFGFKLFMRTFIQVYAYHSRISLGSNSFSFDVINGASFQTKLKKYPENVQQLFERSSDIVKFVRDMLGKGLNCDDLQTLPDTISLLPLFQILIRFKPLMKGEYAKVLQGLALRLLLAQNLTQERILGLVKLVNDGENAKECFEKLEMDPKIEGSDALGKELGKRLKEANSLMNRYVLMLYWLLRKRRACDFSYKNLSDDTRLRNEQKGLHLEEGKEKVLEAGVTPEKQHIVPYGWLEKLYEIERRGRVSRHEVNNIGNITFISHDLNSIDKGLSDNAISLGNDPPGNLAHHFLGEDVGKAYNDAKDLVKELLDKVKDKTQVTPEERKKAKKVFEDFCAQRRDLIQKAFAKWVEDLGPLTIKEEIAPDGRLFVAEAIDRSRNATVGGGRPYEDHLKALGTGSVPGRVLAMLKDKANQTHGRIYRGKAGWISFLWWKRPGLYAREKDGSLEMQFWPSGPVGMELGEKARELFVDCFQGDIQLDQRGAYLNFLPITKDSNIRAGEARVRKLEDLYEKLNALRKTQEPDSAPPQLPDSGLTQTVRENSK
jgi:hypothetical protein